MNNKILNAVLGKALHMKRPHGTASVDYFTDWLWEMLPGYLRDASFLDGAGNLHVDARITDYHKTLFVAHVDTVHREEGINAVRKTDTHWYADGSQLGADDGAGVALLMHMLHNEVAGYYIFTQGEEKGGIGAAYLAKEHAELLLEFDRAIAFDRRGIDSVITHQGWSRCCSDDFGMALGRELDKNNDNMMHLNDDTGVYTDTAEFTGIIPECTNISVGYQFEHSDREELNMVYYKQLADAVLDVEWDFLPVVRDPFVPDPDDKWNGWQYYSTSNTLIDPYMTSDDYAKADLYDAILDAQYGYTKDLEYMIAELVYPDDIELARRHMNMRQLDPRTLDDALAMVDTSDTDDILYMLFDEVHFV